MKPRTLSRLSVVALVIVAAALAILARAHADGSSQATTAPHTTAATVPHLTAGTILSGKPAPDFQLRDQNGNVVSLAAQRGHPVILTFIDAVCTTECPITAQYLDWTAQFLGPHASQVTWLAMTVNPTNTPADARNFMTKNSVKVPLHLLLGTQAQLVPLWHAYYIYVQPTPSGDVEHTIVTYLIDSQGHEAEVLDQTYDPKQASADINALLTSGH